MSPRGCTVGYFGLPLLEHGSVERRKPLEEKPGKKNDTSSQRLSTLPPSDLPLTEKQDKLNCETVSGLLVTSFFNRLAFVSF